jgi:hypothetical protein
MVGVHDLRLPPPTEPRKSSAERAKFVEFDVNVDKLQRDRARLSAGTARSSYRSTDTTPFNGAESIPARSADESSAVRCLCEQMLTSTGPRSNRRGWSRGRIGIRILDNASTVPRSG